MTQCAYLAWLRLQLSCFHRRNILILAYCLEFQHQENTLPCTFEQLNKLLVYRHCPVWGAGISVESDLWMWMFKPGFTLFRWNILSDDFTAKSGKQPVSWQEKLQNPLRVFAIPLTVEYQAPLSMAFSRQDYWSGLPFSSPGDLPDPGIQPLSPVLWADFLPSEPPGKPTWFLEKSTP